MSDFGTLRIAPTGPPGSLRRSLLIDEVEALVSSRDVVRALDLHDGDTVDESQLLASVSAEEPTWAQQRAYRLLNYRERSVAELSDRLSDDGYTKDTVSAVVSRLADLGLVDDSRFAATFVRSKASAGWGRSRIVRALRTAGVSDDLVQAALDEEYPDDDLPRMRAIARRSTVRTRKDADRLVSRLLRQGYDARQARQVANELLSEASED